MTNRCVPFLESEWNFEEKGKSSFENFVERCMRPSEVELAQEMWKAIRETPILKLRRELEELKATVKAQGAMIEELKEFVFEPEVPTENEYDKWLKSNASREYAGQYIAYVREKGVIASSPIIEELMPKLVDDPKQEDITIEIVPRAD